MEVNNKSDKTKDVDPEEAADFEKCMRTAGFGIFNIYLLLAVVTATLGNTFETTTMSYILPIAECDLHMSLFDKGVLNAATYAGMIVSAIAWGYLADTQGRKKILVWGYLADAICVLGSALSQNFEMLVVFKFFGGFIVNGPGAVLYTYFTELHSSKYRARVLMIVGMIMSVAALILPLLAWGIFPRDWEFVIFGGFNIHPWQIFLAVCALPSILSTILISSLPESPRFLMAQGRNAEALRVFQKIYAMNERKPRESFPIRKLMEEVPNRDANANESIYTIENKESSPTKIKRPHRSFSQSVRDGMAQMKPMFRKPLLGHSIHVYLMQFCILMGLNTIRLWLPQLFASIAEYEALDDNKDESSNLCTILEYSVNKSAATVDSNAEACDFRGVISMDMYRNNIIVGITGLVGYFLASAFVKLLGAKRLLTLTLFISGFCGLGLYFSTSGLTTLIISSLFITVGSISASSLFGVVVGLFPTSVKTFIVAVSLMFGRLGALSGNMLFPIFVEIGCMPPFLMVGLILLFAAGLSCILPSEKKANHL